MYETCKNGYNQLFGGHLITIFSSRNCRRKIKPKVLILNESGEFEFREIKKENVI